MFPDWVRAPNIAGNPLLYERENEAIAADGRLDAALRTVADWAGQVLLDIGSGTGFWLPLYGHEARRVIGVEPDPELLTVAQARVRGLEHVVARHGSAEHLPVPDGSIDVAHARFAYFFGPGAEGGLDEVRRVLHPSGTFVAIDNDWGYGEFAELLRDADQGNAAIDPQATDRWWRARGAQRLDVRAAWRCSSPTELASILRMEFPTETVERFLRRHPGRSAISYGLALFVLTPSP